MSYYDDDRRDYGGSRRGDRDGGSRGYSSYSRDRRSPPPQREKTRSTPWRVYIWNLSYRTSWQDLKDHMRKSGGEVQYTKVMQDEGGRSRGCGVVEFGTKEDAEKAIEELNDSELDGRKIGLRWDREGGDDGREGGRDSHRRRGDDRDDYRSRDRSPPRRSSREDRYEDGGRRRSRDDYYD